MILLLVSLLTVEVVIREEEDLDGDLIKKADAVDAADEGILIIVGQNSRATIMVRWGILHGIVGQQEGARIDNYSWGRKGQQHQIPWRQRSSTASSS